MPTKINVSVITPIAKKGCALNQPSSYRPISVSTAYSALLEYLLYINMPLSLEDNHFGFRKSTSTKHAYYVVNETLNYYKSCGTNCYLVSLDAAKAFDHVWRDGLFYKLLKRVDKPFWRTLLLYYRSSTGRININGSKSDSFKINEGVKQGGILSPKLFNFFINELLIEINRECCGAKIGNTSTGVVAYCDDLILLSPLRAEIRKMLEICDRYARAWRIEFNPKKSQVYAPLGNNESFMINNEVIPNVDSLIYLGLPIGGKRFIKDYVQSAYNKIEKTWYGLTASFCANSVNPRCLSFIFKQYCQSVATYSLDVIHISSTDLNAMDVRQSKFIKRMIGVSKFCRSSPLLCALRIESIKQLYLKHKILFEATMLKHPLCKRIFDYLQQFYSKQKNKPQDSFVSQITRTKRTINAIGSVSKAESLSAVKSIFYPTKNGQPEIGLVDSITYLFTIKNQIDGDLYNSMVRNLLFVDFNKN